MNHPVPRVLPRSVPLHGPPSAQERYVTGLHEGKHASYAAYTGSRVLEVDVLRQFTRCRFPFNTAGALWFAWHDHPQQTQRDMIGVLGTLLAPYVGAGDALEEGDATHVRLWQHAWEELPPRLGYTPAPWPVLLHSARRRVERWLGRPGVDTALELAACWLRQQGRITAREWRGCWEWPAMRPLHGEQGLHSL